MAAAAVVLTSAVEEALTRAAAAMVPTSALEEALAWLAAELVPTNAGEDEEAPQMATLALAEVPSAVEVATLGARDASAQGTRRKRDPGEGRARPLLERWPPRAPELAGRHLRTRQLQLFRWQQRGYCRLRRQCEQQEASGPVVG